MQIKTQSEYTTAVEHVEMAAKLHKWSSFPYNVTVNNLLDPVHQYLT